MSTAIDWLHIVSCLNTIAAGVALTTVTACADAFLTRCPNALSYVAMLLLLLCL
jgi:hypothetical protein